MERYDISGILIGLRRSDYGFYVEIKMIGNIIYKDCVLALPILEDVIKRVYDPGIKILVDARKFSGSKVLTMWFDLLCSIKYCDKKFEKVAYLDRYGEKKISSKISATLLKGKIKSFDGYTNALKWLES